jgi:hypothetical protein
LAGFGFASDVALSTAIRSGAYDDDLDDIGRALALSTRDQLVVANPSYLASPAT